MMKRHFPSASQTSRAPLLPSRRQAMAAFAAVVAAPALRTAHAQASAGAPLRVILPVGPASGVDGLVRAAQAALGRELGQAVVIENLPGAGGVIGTAQLVKAAPDGKTIAFIGNNHSVNPSLYKTIPFDSLNDITPLSVIGSGRFVMVVNPNRLPVANAVQLQAALRARPDEYNYASSGNGTIIHLATEIYLNAAGVKARHIPYKTIGQMTNDVVGGQVDFGVFSGSVVRAHLQSGALRAVGVMGSSRFPWMPELQTMKEQGFEEVDISAWVAAIAPKGLREAELRRLHGAIVAAWNSPEVREAMAKQEFSVQPSSSAEAVQFLKAEEARYARIVQQAGIKVG